MVSGQLQKKVDLPQPTADRHLIIKVIAVVKFPLESFGQLWPIGLKGDCRFHMNPWQLSEWHSNEVHWRVLCLPVGRLTDLWLDIIAEWGMGDGQGKGSGKGGDWGQGEFGDLDEISRFAPVHTICQRQWEIMTKGAHLQHLETEGAPLDMSGAGVRDSTMAVGS